MPFNSEMLTLLNRRGSHRGDPGRDRSSAEFLKVIAVADQKRVDPDDCSGRNIGKQLLADWWIIPTCNGLVISMKGSWLAKNGLSWWSGNIFVGWYSLNFPLGSIGNQWRTYTLDQQLLLVKRIRICISSTPSCNQGVPKVDFVFVQLLITMTFPNLVWFWVAGSQWIGDPPSPWMLIFDAQTLWRFPSTGFISWWNIWKAFFLVCNFEMVRFFLWKQVIVDLLLGIFELIYCITALYLLDIHHGFWWDQSPKRHCKHSHAEDRCHSLPAPGEQIWWWGNQTGPSLCRRKPWQETQPWWSSCHCQKVGLQGVVSLGKADVALNGRQIMGSQHGQRNAYRYGVVYIHSFHHVCLPFPSLVAKPLDRPFRFQFKESQGW